MCFFIRVLRFAERAKRVEGSTSYECTLHLCIVHNFFIQMHPVNILFPFCSTGIKTLNFPLCSPFVTFSWSIRKWFPLCFSFHPFVAPFARAAKGKLFIGDYSSSTLPRALDLCALIPRGSMGFEVTTNNT